MSGWWQIISPPNLCMTLIPSTHRYRMYRKLLFCIMSFVCEFDSYFVQSSDAVGQLRLSLLQKCSATMRKLIYGATLDTTNEYCHLGKRILKLMKQLVSIVHGWFEAKYLRVPTRADFGDTNRYQFHSSFPENVQVPNGVARAISGQGQELLHNFEGHSQSLVVDLTRILWPPWW